MPLRAPQSNPDDAWLTVEEAARLLDQSVAHVRRRCTFWAGHGLAEKRPHPEGKTRDCWWVHRAADPRLAKIPDRMTRAEREHQSLLEKHPAEYVEEAYRKFRWLQHWRKACESPRVAGVTDRDLAKRTVQEARATDPDFRISVRSLQAWHAAYKDTDDDGNIGGIAALVPRYNNGGASARSVEAQDYFYALYHAQAKHSVRVCHDTTLAWAKKHGLAWPASYSSTVAWLKREDDLAITCLHREGNKTFSQRFMEYTEIDWDAVEPGHFYVTDHTQCDFWVSQRGRHFRPWHTTIIDCRSRCVVGWHLGETPHQDAILAAFRSAFTNWSIPARLRIDNGKDFASKLLTGVTKNERNKYRRQYGPQWRAAMVEGMEHDRETFFIGVFGELGIDVVYAREYEAWAKGIVERWYGTFNGQCSRTFATYCGNRTENKPDDIARVLRDGRDVPTLDEARAVVADFVDLYHRTPHGGLHGRQPLEVWATATRLRKADGDALHQLMNARGVYKVGPNGVALTIGGQRYTYGRRSAALARMKGRKVFITLDPHDTSHCFAYTAESGKRVAIGRLESNDRIPADATVEEVREANRRVAGRRKLMARARRESASRIRDGGAEIRAMQRDKLKAARATGTDGKPVDANFVPVVTGFEGVSTPVSTRVESTFTDDDHDDYADIDLSVVADDDEYPAEVYDDYDDIDPADLEDDDGDVPTELGQEEIDFADFAD